MRLPLTAFVLSSMLVTAWASADAPSAAVEARRTELYREGVSLADRGDWEGAASRFREVVEIRSAPKALVTLAVAEEKLGHLIEAKRVLVRALKEAEATPSSQAEVVRAATEALARLSPRIPKIHVTSESDGTLSIDGHVVPSPDVAEVDPGHHAIVFASENGLQFEKTVLAAESTTTEVTVNDARAPSGAPLPPPSPLPAPESQPSILGPLLVGGAGVAAVGVGALAWALGRGDEADAKAGCGGRTTDCPRSVESTVDGASTKITAGNILVGVGGAAILGGALWWLLTSRTTKPAAKTVGLTTAPAGGYVFYGTSF